MIAAHGFESTAWAPSPPTTKPLGGDSDSSVERLWASVMEAWLDVVAGVQDV